MVVINANKWNINTKSENTYGDKINYITNPIHAIARSLKT
jgi:hypothetical protein